MSISKADMRKSIYQEAVNSQRLYYSFVNKSQQTLSMMKNQRFLIFNQTKGHLYYINQPQKLPFTTVVPPPKNNLIADMNLTSIVKAIANEFNVQFITNKEKNQMGEWNFICENNSLSTAWVKLLQEYKDMKKNETKKIQQPKKQINAVANKENPFTGEKMGYNGNDKMTQTVVRNHLGYTNVQPLKGDQPIGSNTNLNTSAINTTNTNVLPSLPAQQPKPQQTKPLANNNLTNVNNQPLTNTNTNINTQPVTLNNSKTQPVINDPTINIKQPIINNNPNTNSMGNSRQSIPFSPQLHNSNLTNPVISNTLSRQPLNRTPSANSLVSNNRQRQPQQNSNNNSRLTFKDQIESIIAKSRLSQNNNTENYNNNNRNISNSNLRQSITKSTYNREKDWNWRFYNNPSQNIIFQFQQHSITSLKSILKQDRLSNQTLRVYLQPQSLIIVTNFGSVEAKKIKSEFRNYHFIMEAIKVQPYGQIIGVPLTCLIQYQGLVVMVKSLIPENAPKVQCTQQLLLQIKQLQRYTRVKNSILKKSTLYNLSNIYQTTGKRLLFLNQLIQYLPVHTEQLFYGSLLRPEHLLDNVNQFMHGGLGYQATRNDLKIFDQVTQIIKKNTIQLAKEISCGDVKFTNGQELKNIMHERGINLKYLPLLYNQTTNKQVKKYVHSFMVAKIAKQDILMNIVSTRPERMKASSKPQLHIRELVQKSIKLLVEGNSNVSNQLWKEISITFKKQYGIPISNSDIHGPFFMNSLMGLMRGQYDLGRCNMNKNMFRDQNIVGSGFVVEVGMKVKSYYRWMTEDVESLHTVCKSQKRDEMEFIGVCEMLQLKKKTVPKQLQMCRVTPLLVEYLTSFIPPPQFQPNDFQHLNLYESISLEPPTTHSLNVTVNYLKWCLQFGRVQQFKMAIDQALQLIDLWLGAGNAQKGSVFQCEFYELLSQYYYQQGSVDDSINFLKESLATIIRNNGLGSKKIGNGYYMLGEREMKAGRWSESLQSFVKAKQSMQATNSVQQINYPKTLLKLSQLYLNSNQFENSLLFAKQSIQQFEKQQSASLKSSQPFSKQVYDQFCIKGIQLMTRVFEIENKKNELYRMAQMTATKYNKTKSKKVYQQLIKITLTSMISKASCQKAKLLLSLIEKTISPTIDAIEQQHNPQLKQLSLQQLMGLSLQYNVMERLMSRFQSLQRIITDINGKRTMGSDTKEFINILKPIINIVGEQFIYGLVEQREVEE